MTSRDAGGAVTLNIDYFQFSALARVATSGDGLLRA